MARRLLFHACMSSQGPGPTPPLRALVVGAVTGALAGLAVAMGTWAGAPEPVTLLAGVAVAAAVAGWACRTVCVPPANGVGEAPALPGPDGVTAEEASCHLIAGAAGDLVALLDAEGRFVYLSPSAERKLGLHPEELRGRGLAAILGPGDDREAGTRLEEALRSGSAGAVVRIQAGDGALRWYELALDATGAPGRRAVAVVGRDVTERGRLADQLQRVQRMEAMGRLAGGVAHDFNNVLGIIRSGAELARETLPTGHPAHVELADVSAAADRAAALTRQLLAFARGSGRGCERCDAAQVLESLRSLLPRATGRGVDVAMVLDAGVGEVPLGCTPLEQVVLNLVINARDAMPEGGTIRLTARRRDGRTADGPGLAGGPVVEIAVADDGTGMDESVLRHVFEPFFTTKEARGGTGLGLPTSLGIVREAGGDIQVESVPGKGSTFRVLLPGARGRDRPARATPVATGRKVLLVDRDPGFVALLTRQLSAGGLQVWVAATVSEARQMAASEPGTVDVLVVDLSLGDEHGIEAVGEVRRTNPGARVVLLSGDVRDESDVDHLLDAGIEVVRKPVAPEVVAEVVDRVQRRERHAPGRLLHA